MFVREGEVVTVMAFGAVRDLFEALRLSPFQTRSRHVASLMSVRDVVADVMGRGSVMLVHVCI